MKIKAIVALMTLSISSLSFADYSLSQAFKQCANYSVSGTELGIQKIAINGTSDSVVGIQCYGQAAIDLFNAMKRYSNESTWTTSENERVLRRDSGTSLNCNKRYLNSDQSSADFHWCNIRLELYSNFVKALDL